MGRVTCLVRGCFSKSGEGISLFKLPNDRERLNAWLLACNRNDLAEKDIRALCNYKICERHFESKFKSISATRKHLLPHAIPTLFPHLKLRSVDISSRKKIVVLSDYVLQPAKTLEIDLTVGGTPSTMGTDLGSVATLPKDVSVAQNLSTPVTPKILPKPNEKQPEPEEVPVSQIDETPEKIEIHIKEEEVAIDEDELGPTEPDFVDCSRPELIEYTRFQNIGDIRKMEITYKSLLEKLKLVQQTVIKVAQDREIVKNENNVLKEEITQFKDRLSNLTDGGRDCVPSTTIIDLSDIKGICRICLQKSPTLDSIYTPIQFSNPDISSIKPLQALDSIGFPLVEIGDHLPDKICAYCKTQLKNFIIFKDNFMKKSTILSLYSSKAFQNVPKNVTLEETSIPDYTINIDPVKQEVFEDDVLFSPSIDCNNTVNNKEIESREADRLSSRSLHEKESSPINQELSEGLEENCDLEDIDENCVFEDIAEDALDPFVFKQRLVKTKPPHTCPICFKEVELSEFRSHIRTHKTLEKYLSGPKSSKNTRFYALPRKTVSLVNKTDKSHNCLFCTESLQASEFLLHIDNHMRNDHLTCGKCGRIFNKRSFYLQHMLVHSKELPYKCETCGKAFVIKSNYDCHLLTHSHEENEFPHACEQCGRRFANPTHLQRHKVIHLENRSYNSKYKRRRCQFCLQGFSTLESYTNHRCPVTGGVRGCRYCNKAFTTFKAYQQHFLLVHRVTNKKSQGTCNVCGIVTSNMAYHKQKMHYDKKMSLCSVCGLYVSNIYRHKYTHTKPFKCPVCLKGFSHRPLLTKHMLIHSGAKPYICSYCGKAFNCTYNLQVHERIHIGKKNHVCQLCNKAFLEKSYLKKHMKVHKDACNEDGVQDRTDCEMQVDEL